MSYVEKIDSNVSAHVAISVIFLIYSLFLFIMALWGVIIFPKYCTDSTLKIYFRIMLLFSSCSLVLVVGFMNCSLSCRTLEVKPGFTGTIVSQKSEYEIPNFILFFWITFSLFCLVIQILISEQLGLLKPEENCNVDNFFYYKEINNIGIGLSSFSISLFFILIFFRIKNKMEKRKVEEDDIPSIKKEEQIPIIDD
jgi:hypothetical protein